tara:strand:- start:26 stop:400 length:375 start_codon:yes stop_codon:yes gene_type:complete
VIAPARTGRASKINQAVTKIDHENNGTLNKVIPGARIFKNVVIIFIAPRIDDAPDTWTAKIARSIDIPLSLTDNGGYNTHPTPEPNCPLPPGDNTEHIANDVPVTYSQNDRLFILGKAISGEPI